MNRTAGEARNPAIDRRGSAVHAPNPNTPPTPRKRGASTGWGTRGGGAPTIREQLASLTQIAEFLRDSMEELVSTVRQLQDGHGDHEARLQVLESQPSASCATCPEMIKVGERVGQLERWTANTGVWMRWAIPVLVTLAGGWSLIRAPQSGGQSPEDRVQRTESREQSPEDRAGTEAAPYVVPPSGNSLPGVDRQYSRYFPPTDTAPSRRQ